MEQQDQNCIYHDNRLWTGSSAFLTYADSLQTAQMYLLKLKEKEIPCKMGDQQDQTGSNGLEIYVPQQFYEKAQGVIDSMQFLLYCQDLVSDDTSVKPRKSPAKQIV